MEILTVCGVTNDGKLWYFDGSRWNDVKALSGGDPGPFLKITSADAPSILRENLHICGITQDGRLWHTLGLDKWESFEDVSSRIGGDWGALQDVGAATVNGELHLCVTAPTSLRGYQILHTIRHGDGTWDSFEDVTDPGLAGLPGSFISVACARLNQELHICGVTDDGRLWHTVRSSQNTWQAFEEVKTGFANDPVAFEDVSIVEYATLEVFAQGAGDLWHTASLMPLPGWQPVFDSHKARTGDDPGSFVSVSSANIGGQLYVYGATDDGKLWDTFHFFVPPDWFPFEEVTAEVASPGFFIDVSTARITNPQFLGIDPQCAAFQRELPQDCYKVEHASNANDRARWKQRIQWLEQHWPANCNQPSISRDCLS